MANTTEKFGENDKIVPPETFGENDEIVQDGPLARGFHSTKNAAKMTAQLATNDTQGAAETVAEQAAYNRANPGSPEGQKLMDAWNREKGVWNSIGNVAQQVGDDWNNAKGFVPGLKAVGRDAQAMGSGIVEQVPNMIAPTVGMIGGGFLGGEAGTAIGGAIGAPAGGVGAAPGAVIGGTVGTVAGGWAGASAGNALVEGGDQIQTALQNANIDPNDTKAVKAYLDAHRGELLKATAIKGGVIGAVDTATAGLDHLLLTGPARAATNAALKTLGVDVADKAAVKTAMASEPFKELIANDAVYQASKHGAGHVAREAAAASLEPLGEFTGEYVGGGLANDNWDAKEGFLEAASSIGQSAGMHLGNKAIQYAKAPLEAKKDEGSGLPQPEAGQAQPSIPPVLPPAAQSSLAAWQADLAQQEQQGQQEGQTATPYYDDPAFAQRRQDAIAADRATQSPDDEIYQSIGADTRSPSQRMGLDPSAGTLSASATIAVDSGASDQIQAASAAAAANASSGGSKKAKGKRGSQAEASSGGTTGASTGAESANPATLNTATGEVNQLASWSDEQLASTFRNAQDKGIRSALANELSRRRNERAKQATATPAQPVQDASTATLTDSAQSLLASVADGGVPMAMTRNLRQIAADNGIAVTPATKPNDVITALQQKAQVAQTAPAQVAPATPTQQIQTPAPAMAQAATQTSQPDQANASQSQHADTQSSTPAGAPSEVTESPEARAARVTAAGQAWTQMSPAQRSGVTQAAGLNKTQQRGVPHAVWDKLNPKIQQTLADQIQPARQVASATEDKAAPVAEASTPHAQATQAAGEVLAKGGSEADANRAATDALIGQMADHPEISIAEDAPKAVEAAQQAAREGVANQAPTQTDSTGKAQSEDVGGSAASDVVTPAQQQGEPAPVPHADNPDSPSKHQNQGSVAEDAHEHLRETPPQTAKKPQKSEKSAPAAGSKKAKKNVARAALEKDLGAKKGDTITLSKDHDYAQGNTPYLIEWIDPKAGAIGLRDPKTKTGTWIRYSQAKAEGVKFSRVETTEAETASKPAEQGSKQAKTASKPAETASDTQKPASNQAKPESASEGAHTPAPENPTTQAKTASKPAKPARVADKSLPTAEELKARDAERFAKNKIFTADAVSAARERMRKKLGTLNSGFDPELLQDGLTLAGAFVESGIRDFSGFAKTMIDEVGDAVKPYLLSFWEGVRHYPGIDNAGMTGTEEAARLHAGLMTPEAKEQAGEAIGTIGEKPQKRSKKTGSPADMVLTQDWGVEHIDGYGVSPDREIGNDTKDAFLKDGKKYLNAVADQLRAAGFEAHEDRPGKAGKAVSVNESGPAVSGDITLAMRQAETGRNVYINISDSALRGVVPTTPSGIAIMYRSSTGDDRFGANGHNTWAPTDLSAKDLAGMVLGGQAKQTEGSQHDGSAIRADGTEVLGGMASHHGQGSEGTGDLSAAAAGGERTSSAAGGKPDGERDAAARGGRNGASGNDSAATGAERRGRRRTVKTAAEKAQQSADEHIREASPGNVPAMDFRIDDSLELGKGSETVKYQDNLAAIRTLKQIEQEGRRASPEEQRILARYVGWGGLKNAFRVRGSEEGEGVAKGWESRVQELEGLLTPQELRAAANSTTAAHYTSQTVVNGMWQAMQRLGFNGGAMLESSMGVGNFLGLMPESLRGKTQTLGVEYDSLTARIAQMLYPNAEVLHSGLEKVPLPRNQFALAIGNPPFGNESLYFRHSPSLNGKSIHNQFFLASLDSLAENGLFGQVVSRYLMDALDRSARLEMARRGEFIGAIRLPDTAFKENARTEVVTDMVFFRKLSSEEARIAGLAVDELASGKTSTLAEQADRARIDAAKEAINTWTNSRKVADFAGSGEEIGVNDYFRQNPKMVVGTMDASGKMQAGRTLNVRLEDPATFVTKLDDAIKRLPERKPVDAVAKRSLEYFKLLAEGLRLSINRTEPGAVRRTPDGGMKLVVDVDAGERGKSVMAEIPLTADTPWNPEYTMLPDGRWQRIVDKLGSDGKPVKITKDGKATNRNEKEVLTFKNAADIPDTHKWGAGRVAIVESLLPVRDLVKRQLALEASDAPAKMLEDNRKRLNTAYDEFFAKHGEFSKRANESVALTMPDGALALATEVTNKDGSIGKAAIMSRRVTEPVKPVTHVNTANEAVAVSLAERGRLDLERIASLLGTDEAGAVKALSEGETPRAFFDPEQQNWVAADEYLSGLVKRKLLAAQAAGLDANVKALQAVMPTPWDATQITPTIGSVWIPPEVYADYVKRLGYDKATVRYSPVTNAFTVTYDGKAKAEWATSSVALETAEIVSRLMNSQSMKVLRTDSEGKTYVDQEATAESQLKANEVFSDFQDWAYAEDQRREQLVDIFNEKYNTRLLRQRDGSMLTLPGKVPDEIIRMRRHQLNGIWRGITDNAVLYDHTVGAGKTYTAIARAMERRRMGLSRKPVVIVPNHLVEQWAKDVQSLYPGAKVLAATKHDFERINRRRLFAKIATGDHDLVIMGHSSFRFIELDPATEERYLDQQLAVARQAIEEAQEQAEEDGFTGFRKPFGVKEAERLVKKLEARMEAVRNAKTDRLLTWEEMGIDDLTVDEAHEFKNLNYSSRLSGVAGMGNKTGSGKALDLNLKIQSIREQKGTSIAFLTGTPISNSVAEMYLVLKNLVPNELREMGLDSFDAWRTQFVSVTGAYEPTESGSLKEVNRLGREWNNMRALMDLYYSVADVVTLDDIKKQYAEDNPGKEFPVPKVQSEIRDGKPREMVAIKPTPEQRSILAGIVDGFNGLDDIKDTMERNKARLRLMDQARKVSLDARAVDPNIKVTSKGGKLATAVSNLVRIYQKHENKKGTQLVFLDRSVPKSKGDDRIIKQYDALVAKMREAEAANDEDAVARIQESLDTYNTNEVEELRNAQNGGWNAYDEIKRQLVAEGIPAEEIRFVQEANTDAQKEELFRAVRNGDVRVLIGSTPKMGAGTNVQDRLVALHHVDVTWKPSDIEQREGRIVRQGNLFIQEYLNGKKNPLYDPKFAVEILAYATEMTADAKMWALNAEKLRSINRIRKYDGSFNMEFEDQESASMAEMAALATGNPLMVERVTLDGDIKKLDIARRSFDRRRNASSGNLSSARRIVENAPKVAESYTQFAQALEQGQATADADTAQRSITVQGKTYNTLADADAAAQDAIAAIRGDDKKARFSIEVGGKKVTTQDQIAEAMEEHFGTPGFVAEIDGKRYTSIKDAVHEISNKAFAKGNAYTLDGIKLNGVNLEIDVGPSRWGRSSTEVVYSIVDGNGRQINQYTQTFEGAGLSGNLIRAGLMKMLREKMDAGQYRASAARALKEAEKAKASIPALESEAAKTFPQADELKTKRARMQEVEGLLKNSSSADQLATEETSTAADAATPSDARPAVLSRASAQPVNLSPISLEAAAGVVARLRRVIQKVWHVDLRLAASFDTLPADAKASIQKYGENTKAKGVFHDGVVYVIANEHTSEADLEATILHEIKGHIATRRLYGAEVQSELNALYNSIGGLKGLSELARKRGFIETMNDYAVSLADSDFTDKQRVQIMMEELLAHIAQEPKFSDKVKAIVGAIRDWLRQHGFKALAEYGETDLLHILTQADKALRTSSDTAGPVVLSKSGRDEKASRQQPGAEPVEAQKTPRRGVGIRPIDSALYGMAAEGRSVQDMLGLIAKTSRDPLNRQIARLLMRTGLATKFAVDDGKGMTFKAGKGRNYVAAYDPKSDTGYLFRPVDAERNVLHEAVHAATVKALAKGGLAATQMRRLFQHVQRTGMMGNAYGMANVEEFVAEAFTNPDFQQRLKAISAPIGSPLHTAWDALVRIIKSILGLNGNARADNALSAALDLGVGVMRENMALQRQQGAGPVLGNVASTAKAYTTRATDLLNETFKTPGKLSWWHKTIGTMYNLAERSPEFKRVYDAAQGFIDDVSHYSNDAADMAPTLLPKLDNWKDVLKSPISATDNKAVARPVFDGTLLWSRDGAGQPVHIDDLVKQAEQMTADQKARRLLDTGHITDNVFNMWWGMQQEQFEKAVDTSYTRAFLTPGIVWTPAELKARYGLNAAQIGMYQEFRNATDRSLDNLARADMLRYGGKDAKDLRDVVMDAPDAQAAGILLRDYFGKLADEDIERADQLQTIANGMMDRADKVKRLQDQGYAPLSRFGKYSVYVQENGESTYFGLFETAREANQMAARLRAEYGDKAVTQGVLSQEAYRMFAGMTPETLELFGKALGLDSTGDEARDQLFQQYLRLTKNNRSAMKRLMHRKGIAGWSEDVGRVLASFIYSNGRQTASGLNLGDIGEAVQAIPKEQGQLKDMAVNLAEYVKNPQEEAQALRGLLFAQYLGGSIASAAVNMTQPIAVSFPYLSQFGGIRQAASALAKAAKDANKQGSALEADLARDLKIAEEDGTVSPQEVHQLMAQAQGRGGLRTGDGTKVGDAMAKARNAFSRVTFGWGKVFGMAEQLNRRMTYIAAYRIAKQQKIADPAAFARKAVIDTQFQYSKANKMVWGRGAIGGTLMTFKTYSIAYLELMHRMWTQGGKDGKRGVLLALGVMMLLGGAGGLPFEEDAEDVIDGLAQLLGYNFSTKQARQNFLREVFGDGASEFIDNGISGLPGVPIDVSGRLGMGNLIPGTGLLQSKTSHTSDVMELLGPVGDLATRTGQAAGQLLQGNVGDAALQLSPLAVRNAAKGADMATTGMYRDAKGYKVIDTTGTEAAMKAIGFQPHSVKQIQEANAEAMQAKSYYNLRAQEIREKWAAGIFEHDPVKVQEARDAVADWNRKNPDQRMVINMPAVLKRVREMNKPKDERIAATAPKSMRVQMREDLARARGDS